MNHHFDSFISKHWPKDQNSEFKSVDFTEVLDDIFNSIIHIILFDDKELSDIKVEGKSLSVAVEEIVNDHILEMYTMNNALSFGFLPSIGIGSHISEGKKLEAKVRKALGKAYDKRMGEPLRARTNLIDLIKEDNMKRPEEEKWTKEEILSNMIMFEIAGADTTKAFSKNMLIRFARESRVKGLFTERFEALNASDGYCNDMLCRDDYIHQLV